MKTILVTGAYGYIGSHICENLKRKGYRVVGVDRNTIKNPFAEQWIDHTIEHDFSIAVVGHVLQQWEVDAVVHCAATSLVGPSVKDPSGYYENNLAKTKKILDELAALNIPVVFSSSSSVYGNAENPEGLTEDLPLDPLTSYGKSKMMVEEILEDYYTAYNLSSVSFRFFNVAGASRRAALGQQPDATHLIARVMEHLLFDREFAVYGNDYNTKDGTCVRDYVHIEDVVSAHLLAVDYLLNNNGGAHRINLGSGEGSSIYDIIRASETVTGKTCEYEIKPRRAGDPDSVTACIDHAKSVLNWTPKYTLSDIVADAHKWYRSKSYQRLVEKQHNQGKHNEVAA